MQNLPIEIEDGVERLILGAGREMAVVSQSGQKTFEFLFTGQDRWPAAQRANITPQPVDIIGLGGWGFVLPPQDRAQLVNGAGEIHKWNVRTLAQVTGRRGRVFAGAALINDWPSFNQEVFPLAGTTCMNHKVSSINDCQSLNKS